MAVYGSSPGHKGRNGRLRPLPEVEKEAERIRRSYTPTERAALAEHDAASVLPRVLAHDKYFLTKVDRVRGRAHDARVQAERDPIRAEPRANAARKKEAYKQAGSYFRRGRARKVIASLLAEAALVEHPRNLSRRPGQIATQLTNKLGRAVWTEAPLVEGDRVRWLRKDLLQTLEQGAERIARRGRGCCLECGQQLAQHTVEGHRRDYCIDHEDMPWLRSKHEEQMQQAVEATADALRLDTEQGPLRRRRTTRTWSPEKPPSPSR